MVLTSTPTTTTGKGLHVTDSNLKSPTKESKSGQKMACFWQRMQPMQLYIVLGLTVCFFLAELIVAHTTHALVLLMDAYHMLCNIIALSGCIITIMRGKSQDNQVTAEAKESPSPKISTINVTSDVVSSELTKSQQRQKITRSQRENKLRNTFGWARIDVIVMLICCVFLASLCFSVLVEALQTLFHIDHQHEVHQPIVVLCVGAAGLLLNGICYLLIGGYTFHQGSFLYVTESGDVVLDRVVTGDSVQKGARRLSRTRSAPVPPQFRQRQGFREMLRDVVGSIFVIICGLATYFTESQVAKFLDPALSIISASSLLYLSYPYMKESGLILLQTIPDTINVDIIKNQLIENFPDIINVHDLHIWQMTASKVISTVHIIFQNPKVYNKIVQDIRDLFSEHGITHVTIQPEFFWHKNPSLDSLESTTKAPLCLVKCTDTTCLSSHCCPTDHLKLAGWKSREFLGSTNSIAETNVQPDPATNSVTKDGSTTEE